MAVPRPLVRLAARIKPHIPDSAWPTLLTARSLLGSGPVIAPPVCDRALVLVAHPDDETIGCGGTIALLTDAGAAVEIVAATDGDATIGSTLSPEETGARRRAELVEAAALLGATTSSLGLPDGQLASCGAAVAAGIAEAIDRFAPEIVFAPWLGDGHRDHRAVAFALADVLEARPDADLEIWGYETWSAVPHNRLVPIDAAIDRKRRALELHVTASGAFDLSAGLGLSRWHAMHMGNGRGHGEAFLACTAPDFVALAARASDFDPRPDAGRTDA